MNVVEGQAVLRLWFMDLIDAHELLYMKHVILSNDCSLFTECCNIEIRQLLCRYEDCHILQSMHLECRKGLYEA